MNGKECWQWVWVDSVIFDQQQNHQNWNKGWWWWSWSWWSYYYWQLQSTNWPASLGVVDTYLLFHFFQRPIFILISMFKISVKQDCLLSKLQISTDGETSRLVQCHSPSICTLQTVEMKTVGPPPPLSFSWFCLFKVVDLEISSSVACNTASAQIILTLPLSIASGKFGFGKDGHF